jgi:protocatechuate 3,4-dioxygenase beta subunit
MNSFTIMPFSFLKGMHSTSFIKKHLFLLLLLLICTPHTTKAQETQQPGATEARATSPSGGSIGGRITSEDGQPLASATVYVYRVFASGTGQAQPLSTDEEGKFQATNLSQGLYSVSAVAPGLISQPDTLTGTGEARYYRVGDTVNLTLIKGGVITGTVRDANGEPLVAVPVNVLRVRDGNGRALTYNAINVSFGQSRMTDDRGIYRIYGLTPGAYLVSAGRSLGFSSGINAYEGDAPTYYPSSTRDTAAEVPVRGGEEATNIDIRYRGERGHTISGTISGTSSDTGISYGISLTLRQTSNGAYELNSFVAPNVKPAFSMQGVADGVYDLIAQQGSSTGNAVVSNPRRITVKGADVTGVELTLIPLGSIAGRATLEPAQKKEGCQADARPATLVETLINARRAEKSQAETSPLIPFYLGGGGALTEQGEFTIRNVGAGSYRLSARLPTDFWYVRSVAVPGTMPARTPAPPPASKAAETKSAATLSLINLKAGENLAGVTVNIAQDGATLRGRMTAAAENADAAGVPSNLKVYLVPAERERAEDLLRYAEVKPNDDGTFSFANLAPGRYWLIARPFIEDESPDHIPRPLAWDTDARAKLRREAEAQNTTVELSPCKRVTDQILRYAASK